MPSGADADRSKKLEWRDYVALFIALLQTVALPLVLLIVAILAALVIFRLVN